MIKTISRSEECESFIRSYLCGCGSSLPFIATENDLYQKVDKAFQREDEIILGTCDRDDLNGLFIIMVLEDEKYLESMLLLSAEKNAYDELFEYMKQNYRGYDFDLIFNPKNQLLKEKLKNEKARFDTEQQIMFFVGKPKETDVSGIEQLSKKHEKGYIAIHDDDKYWTGEKVIEAQDRFRTYVAQEKGETVGYIDVTSGRGNHNEVFDLLVREEYRRKGYGRKLLRKALLENLSEKMILTADVDNQPAIALYSSMGFVKEEDRNVLTCHWHIH